MQDGTGCRDDINVRCVTAVVLRPVRGTLGVLNRTWGFLVSVDGEQMGRVGLYRGPETPRGAGPWYYLRKEVSFT